jgi:hypothetical protein
VRGVINLRGRVVPVVDLAVRFGLPPSAVTRLSCVVIVEVALGDEPVVIGVMADAVSQVVELGAEEIEASPSFGTRVDVAFLQGLGRVGKRFVLLLDIDRLLSTDETEELAGTGRAPEAAPPPGAGAGGAGVGGAGAAAAAVLALLLAASAARAQEPIRDNSFLIEEAYNQEKGVVQHISAFSRGAGSGDWLYSFTQEWPLGGERHQLSFTLPVQEVHSGLLASAGVGDVAVSYRYQALGVGGGAVAFSPRLSVLAPTGRSRDGLGAGGAGLQVNLPLSWGWGRHLVTHWNAGATHTFSARGRDGSQAGTNALSLGQSVVWLAHPRVNLMLETSYLRAQAVSGPRSTATSDALFVSPGVRWSHDLRGGLQIVPGVAFPIGVGPSRGEHALFLYLSLEHPFQRQR